MWRKGEKKRSYYSVIFHINDQYTPISSSFYSLFFMYVFIYVVDTLQKSMLSNISSMAVLIEHSFLEAYGGESRDGSSTAKFSTGDIISLNSAVTTTNDLNDLCYAVLAILRSRFAKMEGITAGLCFKGQSKPRVVCIHVWKSLHFCYSWILNSDHRNWMMPYLERFSINMKYDIFRVVYVSGDNVVDLNCISTHQMLENGKESSRQGQVMQN